MRMGYCFSIILFMNAYLYRHNFPGIINQTKNKVPNPEINLWSFVNLNVWGIYNSYFC